MHRDSTNPAFSLELYSSNKFTDNSPVYYEMVSPYRRIIRANVLCQKLRTYYFGKAESMV